jgi:hypothetical protein
LPFELIERWTLAVPSSAVVVVSVPEPPPQAATRAQLANRLLRRVARERTASKCMIGSSGQSVAFGCARAHPRVACLDGWLPLGSSASAGGRWAVMRFQGSTVALRLLFVHRASIPGCT